MQGHVGFPVGEAGLGSFWLFFFFSWDGMRV